MKTPKYLKHLAILGSAALVLGVALPEAVQNVQADHHEGKDAQHELLEKIMKETHKGKDSLVSKVIAGEACATDVKLLLGYYLAMEKMKPEKGDLYAWQERTAALTKATAGVLVGVDGAGEKLKTAVNCKACHEAHRPE